MGKMLDAQQVALKKAMAVDNPYLSLAEASAVIFSTLINSDGSVVELPIIGPLAPVVDVAGLPKGYDTNASAFQKAMTKARLDMAELGRPATVLNYVTDKPGRGTLYTHAYDPVHKRIAPWGIEVRTDLILA